MVSTANLHPYTKEIQDPGKVCKKIKVDPPEAPSWAGQCDKYKEVGMRNRLL